jgi:hypothetical protein
LPHFVVSWNKTKGASIFFLSSELENELCTSSLQLADLALSKLQALNNKALKVSPLRDLLDELKVVTERCASKNRWSVPTGVEKLLKLLSGLNWKKDEELPQLLKKCHEVIAERVNGYWYLERDEFTYFLYKNFYPIFKKISEESFEAICEKINVLSDLAGRKYEEANQAFTHLYQCLLEIKGSANSEQWNNKGKTLGIFANKLPDGISCLRMSFNKFPVRLPLKDDDKLQLIKIFMQIKEILSKKVLYSKDRPFRAAEVAEFYEDLYSKIQTIYNVLSKDDKEIFCVVHGEENLERVSDILAIPKGYALLSHPGNILNLFEFSSEPKPGCSHWT